MDKFTEAQIVEKFNNGIYKGKRNELTLEVYKTLKKYNVGDVAILRGFKIGSKTLNEFKRKNGLLGVARGRKRAKAEEPAKEAVLIPEQNKEASPVSKEAPSELRSAIISAKKDYDLIVHENKQLKQAITELEAALSQQKELTGSSKALEKKEKEYQELVGDYHTLEAEYIDLLKKVPDDVKELTAQNKQLLQENESLQSQMNLNYLDYQADVHVLKEKIDAYNKVISGLMKIAGINE